MDAGRLDNFIARHMRNGKRMVDRRDGWLVQYEVAEVMQLLDSVRQVLKTQSMLTELHTPIIVLGDIHGQFDDLLRCFEAVGWPHERNFLFLGDYVDRGQFSLETICLLFAYKLKFPTNLYLLRGNHELASINRLYGFLNELQLRFTPADAARLHNEFNDVFSWMPIAAVIDGRVLAMHGGIGPTLNSFEDIRRIHRPPVEPLQGLAQDLLWSDPFTPGGPLNDQRNIQEWDKNLMRGVSFIFGPKAVTDKCALLQVDLIVRAHQVVLDGYEFYAGRKLVTLFSAPKYCNEFDNCAAILHIDSDLRIRFTILKPRPEQELK